MSMDSPDKHSKTSLCVCVFSALNDTKCWCAVEKAEPFVEYINKCSRFCVAAGNKLVIRPAALCRSHFSFFYFFPSELLSSEFSVHTDCKV